MAVLLRLNDGSSPYSLTSGGNVLVTAYTPKVGGDAAPTVVDTVELLLYGTSAAAVQAAAWSIDNFVRVQAPARQINNAGPRIYLEQQLDADSEYWRSEIVGGRLELAEGALDIQSAKKMFGVLIIERVNFWESSEIELAISTSSSGAGTGGKTIENHDDAGAGDDNWVEIAAGQVGGSLPAPCRITLTNNVGSSQAYRNLYVAINAYSDPANFAHILEGEGAAPSYGTSTSDSNSSNSAYLAKTWSGSTFIQWTLPAAVLQDGAGRFFRLLARFVAVSGAFYAKPVIRDSTGLVDLFVGDEVLITSATALADLGAVPLPPNAGAVSWSNLTLLLFIRATASTTIGLDFIQFTPNDSFARIYQRGLNITNGGTITIDSIDNTVHAGGQPIFTPIGLPLLLYPNLLQRIIFLHDTNASTPPIANTFSVRVYYRKRRSSL